MIIPTKIRLPGLAIMVLVAVVDGGCASWNRDSNDSNEVRLPPNPMMPRAVALEIAVAQIDQDQLETLETLWNQLDHQAIDLETRKRLDQNGLRAGVVPPKPPESLNQLLEDKPIDVSDLEPWQQQFVRSGHNKQRRLILHERIQNGEGEAHQVPVSDVLPVATWSVATFDSQSTGQGEQVRVFCKLTTYPKGDGRVTIELVPEIHHGRQRPTIGVADEAFFFKNQQSVQVLNELKVMYSLRPGETLIMGPNAQLSELGGVMFGHGQRNDFWHRLLLIRLVRTQHDDLFETKNTR
jgi:hypothetical protein